MSRGELLNLSPLVCFPGLRKHGKDWTAVANFVGTKSEAQCKNFFFNYKKKLNLEALIEEQKDQVSVKYALMQDE